MVPGLLAPQPARNYRGRRPSGSAARARPAQIEVAGELAEVCSSSRRRQHPQLHDRNVLNGGLQPAELSQQILVSRPPPRHECRNVHVVELNLPNVGPAPIPMVDHVRCRRGRRDMNQNAAMMRAVGTCYDPSHHAQRRRNSPLCHACDSISQSVRCSTDHFSGVSCPVLNADDEETAVLREGSQVLRKLGVGSSRRRPEILLQFNAKTLVQQAAPCGNDDCVPVAETSEDRVRHHSIHKTDGTTSLPGRDVRADLHRVCRTSGRAAGSSVGRAI